MFSINDSFLVMLFDVFALCRANEIFNTIVMFYSINMMDNLIFVEELAKMLIHDKAMFKNEIVFGGKRVSRRVDHYIAVFYHSPVAIPILFIWEFLSLSPSWAKAKNILSTSRRANILNWVCCKIFFFTFSTNLNRVCLPSPISLFCSCIQLMNSSSPQAISEFTKSKLYCSIDSHFSQPFFLDRYIMPEGAYTCQD